MKLASIAHFLLPVAFVLISSPVVLSEGDDCQKEYDSFTPDIFGGKVNPCVSDSDESCPSSCVDTLSKIHGACKGKQIADGEGGTDPYSLAGTIALQVLFASSGCFTAMLDWAFARDDVPCEDLIALQSFACLDPNDCTDTCKSALKKYYDTCNEKDTLTDEDGKTFTVGEYEKALALTRSDECKDYVSPLSFKGTLSSTASTNLPITSFVIISNLLFFFGFIIV